MFKSLGKGAEAMIPVPDKGDAKRAKAPLWVEYAAAGKGRAEIRLRNLVTRGEEVVPGDTPADGLWPETVEKFGTAALGFTIPFVAFGIFRYLDLAYRQSKGDRPDKILLTDLPILLTVALYGLTVIAVFLLKG